VEVRVDVHLLEIEERVPAALVAFYKEQDTL
jgi:hypothetical protein